MNTTASPDPTTDARPQAGEQVDLEHVNPLQQAVIERARAAETRGKWLPGISTPQWIVSALVAVAVVYGIFKIADNGLAAFQKFAEVYMRSNTQPAADLPAAPEVDLTQPVPIILVPESGGAPPPASPPDPP